MPDYISDFQAKVRIAATPLNTSEIRECYGLSNCAKFVTGGFLLGIPNLDNLDETSDALCVFSKIQLSPGSELHTAIIIRENLRELLSRLKEMLKTPGVNYADKNNNCALLLAPDGKVYTHNKSKATFELTAEILTMLGPGIEPDTFYWAVYGNAKEAEGGAIEPLQDLVGPKKFVNIPGQVVSESKINPHLLSDGLTSIVRDFLSACEAAGFRATKELTQRYAASLLAKRFLILTGLAGSGKTKLAQAFAQWISATEAAYHLVPVGADWTGSESILGYPDGLQPNHYVSKPAMDLILQAEGNPNIPHFLILDEMNLSHVERYFAEILSIIESDESLELYSADMQKLETWRKTAAEKSVPPRLKQLPTNLFIIGTVNVDETTYMFSPKVLDRANVLEFRMAPEDLEGFLKNASKPVLAELSGLGNKAGYAESFVVAANDSVTIPTDVKKYYDDELLLFFGVLQPHGAEFGYRTAYEAGRFIHYYKLLGEKAEDDNEWFKEAFDCVIVQKLLPKLHGSRAKLAPVLKKLWFLCVSDSAARSNDPLMAADNAALSTDKKTAPGLVIPAGAPYKKSAEKIARMWRLLMDNGFASFAEA